MRGKPKIIIGGEVDDSLAVKRAERRLLVVQNAEFEMRALRFQVSQLIG
jgi:hypothetical protein